MAPTSVTTAEYALAVKVESLQVVTEVENRKTRRIERKGVSDMREAEGEGDRDRRKPSWRGKARVRVALGRSKVFCSQRVTVYSPEESKMHCILRITNEEEVKW